MQVFKKHKSPGNKCLRKEFYKTLWDDLNEIFVSSVTKAKEIGHLSTSQRQAFIKLIEKKDRDKRFVTNWRPISLLNVDSKVISKALSEKLKEVLPDLISSKQTTYVKNRHIRENGRLISDIVEITKIRKIGGFLVSMNIEKAFDSLDHNFVISTLEKYGFGQNFILWVKILLNDQESCVFNGGKTTKYFMLSRGARQGDPISAFSFILALDFISSHKDKTVDCRTDNILSLLPLLCIC